MTMPVNLLVYRHAESESNAAKRAADNNRPYARERDLMGVHTSQRRLMVPKGINQAKRAGEWTRRFAAERAAQRLEKPFENARFFVSPYARAMETAYLMDLSGDIKWRPDDRLCERNWGELDHMTHEERTRQFAETLKNREAHALFWTPYGGESLHAVKGRLWQFCDMLHRQCSTNDVYAVCHGETMWALRSMVEYWMPRKLADMMIASDDDYQNKTINCRIIHYTREREDGSLADHIVRVRLIDPSNPDDPSRNLDWQPVVQTNFTTQELGDYVNNFEHFLKEPA